MGNEQILFFTIAGSHMFGTATPNSDMDYAAVFMSSIRDIVLGRASGNFKLSTNKTRAKNNSSDVDTTFYEVRGLLRKFVSGETNAIDVIFSYTNASATLFMSDTWKRVIRMVENGDLRIEKLAGVIGYARHQMAKYGAKGSNLWALNELRRRLMGVDHDAKIGDVIFLGDGIEGVTRKIVNVGRGKEAEGLYVIGRTLHPGESVKSAIKKLTDWIDRYGARAKLAMENKGIDWKAVSHALRSAITALQYAKTGRVVYPLSGSDLKLVMAAKNGEMTFAEADDIMASMIDELRVAEKKLMPCGKCVDEAIASIYGI